MSMSVSDAPRNAGVWKMLVPQNIVVPLLGLLLLTFMCLAIADFFGVFEQGANVTVIHAEGFFSVDKDPGAIYALWGGRAVRFEGSIFESVQRTSVRVHKLPNQAGELVEYTPESWDGIDYAYQVGNYVYLMYQGQVRVVTKVTVNGEITIRWQDYSLVR